MTTTITKAKRKYAPRKVPLSGFRLTDDIKAKLQNIANQHNITMSQALSVAITYLSETEPDTVKEILN
jgi:predicted transcriptional regulator